MLVKVIYQQPGNHHEIGEHDMPCIPVAGDEIIVCLNGLDEVKTVHAVRWSTKFVELFIRD